MANSFGTDILIQSADPKSAAKFYVDNLGFEISEETPQMVSLCGKHINLFIERGPELGPVLEVTVASVEETKQRLARLGLQGRQGRAGVSALLYQGSLRVDLQLDQLIHGGPLRFERYGLQSLRENPFFEGYGLQPVHQPPVGFSP